MKGTLALQIENQFALPIILPNGKQGAVVIRNTNLIERDHMLDVVVRWLDGQSVYVPKGVDFYVIGL